jgi:Ca2+-binding EF-hand superfamily protein
MIKVSRRPCIDSARLLLATAMAVLTIGVCRLWAAAPSAGDALLFERLDADKNQSIAAAEVPSQHQRLFARLLRRGDENGDEVLSRDEFLAALVPTRPEKPLEATQPSDSPQADAIRYVLLTMDGNRNSRIEAEEVPDEMQPVLDAMLERLDANRDERLDRMELSRGFPALAQIAGRFVARDRIDVTRELKKLEAAQGAAADRFDRQRPMLESLRDPSQAQSIFTQLDANGDGKIDSGEVPEPFQPQLERLLRFADRDRDNRLSEREFVGAIERFSRFQDRRRGAEMQGPDERPTAAR